MFLEPVETPYDLRFHVLGTPVRVNVWFWVVSAFLGWSAYTSLGVGYLGLWVACVFVSVLLHELGHVWVGQAFGSHGHIILYSFGGLAIDAAHLAQRWQRVCVLLAGPGAQLVLFAVVWTFDVLWGPESSLPVMMAIDDLKWINLAWALLNLAPIWPLDGGQICRELLVATWPQKGVVASLWVSMAISAVIALHSFFSTPGRPWIPFLPPLGQYSGFFFALMCLSSWQALQAEEARGRRWDDERSPWER